MGENRVQLLVVEVEEERNRLFRLLLLALGASVFGLLASMAFTALLVFWLWSVSPAGALLGATTVYATASVCLYRLFQKEQQNWQSLQGTLEQLKKDRACLENALN